MTIHLDKEPWSQHRSCDLALVLRDTVEYGVVVGQGSGQLVVTEQHEFIDRPPYQDGELWCNSCGVELSGWEGIIS